jgi:hypothetical protein
MGMAHLVLTLPVIFALTLPDQPEIAQAQEVSTERNVNSEHDVALDPCKDPSTPSALKDALRWVCSRERADLGNRSLRKAIIIGFVGGFVKGNDAKHPEVLFAAYLRRRYGSAVQAETFANRDAKKAIEKIIQRLDSNKDGLLTSDEKEQVKIILYGHSWGASQVLAFARELDRRGITVSLTIQIDSIKKFGQNDRIVPANVAKAVNFYQSKGLTRGQPFIVAADATRTRILGNFHMTYGHHGINCDNYGWNSRVFNKPHHEIENDPFIWDEIALLIDSELSRTGADIQAATPSKFPREKAE